MTRSGHAPIAALLALAAGAWALTAARMHGMDAAPGADLGGLGWFAVTWLAMMAAMMLPALVPAALRTARTGVPAFVAGYLGLWSAAGLAAYGAVEAVRAFHIGFLAWDQAGRYLAAGVLLVAAGYQLTPLKSRCLDRCRATARGSGLRHGAYCVGCSAWLMASLFALGVMNLTWMVAMAALIGAERLLPWRTPAVWGVAAALAVLALWVAIAPGHLPGFTLPGSMARM